MLRCGLSIEEETGAGVSLLEEVCSESSNPAEDGETGASLEDEKRDNLLEEQSNDDGGPDVWMVA